MNSGLDKYLIIPEQPGITKKQLYQTLDELHKSFASLTQEEHKYANIFLRDLQ